MHNIKPELVPVILQILDEKPKQCSKTLSKGPGCYCFEGLIAEALIRLYPDRYSWGRYYPDEVDTATAANWPILLRDGRVVGDGVLWSKAREDATLPDKLGYHPGPELDGQVLWCWNDVEEKNFDWLREQLTKPAEPV